MSRFFFGVCDMMSTPAEPSFMILLDAVFLPSVYSTIDGSKWTATNSVGKQLKKYNSIDRYFSLLLGLLLFAFASLVSPALHHLSPEMHCGANFFKDPDDI